MSTLAQRLAELSSAEDFLDFFGLTYDQPVVDVHRLHILKRFHQYLRRDPIPPALDENGEFAWQRGYLERAYGDFVVSTAAQEKVFKVFQDAEGPSVTLESLRRSRAAVATPE